MKKPIISIITVVYNGENCIEATIKSVIDQSYQNIEYIIVDGQSSDKTIEIIRRYNNEIDYWVSEKDNGIYDAMNKGILAAKGDYINFMNAGDIFSNKDVLNKINFSNNFNLIYAGDVNYLSGKRFIALNHPFYLKNPIHHQGAFYPKSLFSKISLYSLKFSVLADYDFNFNAYVEGYHFVKLDFDCAVCSDGGVSDVPKLVNYKEEIIIRNKYEKSIFLRIFGYFYSLLRYAAKRIKAWI
jgi:putative colanic acid biosynthesis glycosyltransferase